MFKLVALFALIAVASAGLLDYGYSGNGLINNGYAGHGQVLSYAPAGGYHAQASSYANHNSLSVNPVAVVISHGGYGHGGY